MKRLVGSVVALFVISILLAPVSAVLAGEKTHSMKGEVVSIDLEKNMLTFKDEKGESHTAPVMGKAMEPFKTLKAGDKVMLTCTDSEAGAHEGISDIKKEEKK